ncbi:uncharacterized protein LOC102805262 [Saccoglossus kowalevskii]|uniref:Collagen alpha-1(V) chain-like n=1 Tax=Saccoglossus kowalevskii TaxID=10224 RepID=A0ABM0M177_SACKO|nr:PREDICTED: collagen alpha-1(V) chain-like [Saccoglossus kowalevskii]
MSSEIGKEKSHEMGIGSSTPLGGIFKVKWIKRANVSFQQTSHLSNPWNENRKVKVARDGQELEPSIGDKLLQLWSKVEEYKHGSGDASSRTTPANSPPNHSPGPKGGKGKNSDKSKSPQFHTQTPPMTPQYPKSSPLLGTVPPFSPAHPQVYQTPTGSPIPLAHSSPSHYPGMVFQPRGASGDYFNAGAMSQLSLGNNAPMMHPNMYNQYGQKGGSPGNRGGIPGNRGGSPGNRGGSRRNGGQHRNKSYDKSDNKK